MNSTMHHDSSVNERTKKVEIPNFIMPPKAQYTLWIKKLKITWSLEKVVFGHQQFFIQLNINGIISQIILQENAQFKKMYGLSFLQKLFRH